MEIGTQAGRPPGSPIWELWNYKVKGLSGQVWGMFLLGAEVERKEMKSNKSYLKGQKYQEEILKKHCCFFASIPTPHHIQLELFLLTACNKD